RTPEQQQADQEQKVIRPDQNVMDTRRDELANDSEDTLPRTREVFGLRVIDIENDLGRQRVRLINVDEGLVVGIIGKHQRRHRDAARRILNQVAQMESDGLPFLKDLRLQPFGWERTPVSCDL